MTAYIHRIVFGAAANATNRERLQRLGYAVFEPGLTNQQRLSAINGTTSLAIILASPQSRNFQSPYTRSAKPTGPEFLIGSAAIDANEWARIQSRIAQLPATWRYLRAQTSDGETWQVVECPEWPALIGRRFEHVRQLLADMGFTPWEGQ